jgi:hypothetical protein
MIKKKQPHRRAVIGIDLGDKQHAICVLDKDGNIFREFSIPNHSKFLQALVQDYPDSRIAMELGTHSPWISRLLSDRHPDRPLEVKDGHA